MASVLGNTDYIYNKNKNQLNQMHCSIHSNLDYTMSSYHNVIYYMEILQITLWIKKINSSNIHAVIMMIAKMSAASYGLASPTTSRQSARRDTLPPTNNMH